MSTVLAVFFASCAPLVDPTTLRALIQVESAGEPFALSVNHVAALEASGRTVPAMDPQPRSLREAVSRSRELLAQGYTLSVGLTQINTEHWSEFRRQRSVRNLEDLFDPCTNLRAAQSVLLECRAQGKDPGHSLSRVLSCYNSGDPTLGIHNGYVRRIVRAAQRIPAGMKESDVIDAHRAHPL